MSTYIEETHLNNTVNLLNRYKSHLINKKNNIELCKECNNFLSIESIQNEILSLDSTIYKLCHHDWFDDFIEIREEMHPITLCKKCNLKKI